MIDEMGFDFKTDMFNIGHLNISGSEKVTFNLGEFLKENYTLADHRTDVKFKKWESDYHRYSKVSEAAILKKETDIKNYFSLIKNKNYIIVG